MSVHLLVAPSVSRRSEPVGGFESPTFGEFALRQKLNRRQNEAGGQKGETANDQGLAAYEVTSGDSGAFLSWFGSSHESPGGTDDQNEQTDDDQCGPGHFDIL
jgi:hypothetical protein